jgi:hypothetical protein
MTFDNLRDAIVVEHNKALLEKIHNLDTEKGIKEALSRNNKNYKGNIKAKLIKFFTRENVKTLTEKIQQLKSVEEAPDFSIHLTVSLDWTPSRMWRSNPRAYTNFGFKGDSVGGCGYDKRSTALAEGLNSHLPLLKLMYKKKDEELPIFNANPDKLYKDVNGKEHYGRHQHNINTELFGYGAGYNILPRFEGGVGYESHKGIIESLGLTFEAVTSAPNSDVFIISKKEA